jgi:hypothetical protein
MKPPGPEAQLVRFILDLDEFCFLMAVTGSEAKDKATGSSGLSSAILELMNLARGHKSFKSLCPSKKGGFGNVFSRIREFHFGYFLGG